MTPNQLPETGFLRLPQIIGQSEVTPEQAAENKARGKGPKRARPGYPGLVPIRKTTWWHGIRTGRYPKPVHLGPRVAAWKVEDIRRLLADLAEGQ